MSQKSIIHSDLAPKAIGPYSQAVKVGQTVYLSGQIPLDPVKMEIVGNDVASQAEQVFKNLRAVAQASGGDFKDIVKLLIYTTDLSQFPVINDIMSKYFVAPFPARATVGVASLPKGALVEVEAIMVLSQ